MQVLIYIFAGIGVLATLFTIWCVVWDVIAPQSTRS